VRTGCDLRCRASWFYPPIVIEICQALAPTVS
jgi:hypothetical protein